MELKSQITTTREQSKRLLAMGLKPETADMVYHYTKGRMTGLEWELQPYAPTLRGEFWTPKRIARLKNPFLKHPDGTLMNGEEVFDSMWGQDIPAWSLGRLIELLPIFIDSKRPDCVIGLHHETDGSYTLSYSGIKYVKSASLIENCILMIENLIESNNEHFNKEYLK